MSLFGDLDIENAKDNPFEVPPGTYNAVVSAVEVRDSNDKTKKGLWITYTVEDDGEVKGNTASEWKTIPQPVDPKNPSADDAKALSFIKMRLASLGVPENRMNSVQPDDLIGASVVISVARKGDYTNITKVVARNTAEVPTANPFL